MSARILLCRPAATGTTADALFLKRIGELADDLKLPLPPRLRVVEGPAALEIDGMAVRIERALDAGTDGGLGLAERAAATLFRQRWRLLAKALRAEGIVVGPRLEQLAMLGLDLDDLRELARNHLPADREWAVPALCPPTAALLTAEPPPDARQVAALAKEAVELTSLRLPIPTPLQDPRLAAGTARFQLRRVRGPVFQPGVRRPAAAYARDAAIFVDAAAVVALLIGAGGTPLPEAGAVLESAPPAAIAAGLRRVVNANLRLPQPSRLWAALQASRSSLPRAGARLLVMPGYSYGGADGLAADRMRAALMPITLVRRAGGPGEARSVWRLTEAALAQLDGPTRALEALSDAVRPCARADAVLLVPDGQGWRISDMLCADYPDLLVAEEGEWPADIPIIERARIALRRIS